MMLKKPSSRNRANAPIVATHLPTRNERIANSTPSQMNGMPISASVVVE